MMDLSERPLFDNMHWLLTAGGWAVAIKEARGWMMYYPSGDGNGVFLNRAQALEVLQLAKERGAEAILLYMGPDQEKPQVALESSLIKDAE
jgi:hypothetical protein